MVVVTQNNLLLFHRTTKMEKGTNILQNIAHLSLRVPVVIMSCYFTNICILFNALSL